MTWLTRTISLHSFDSPREELASGLTHLLGVVLALAATARLWSIPGGIVLGVAMILLFSASTLYHLTPRGDLKRLFRLCDHLSIFILIAGTYTPVMLHMDSPWAYTTLAIVWGLALTGITLKTILWDRFKRMQIVFFLAMGWLIVFNFQELRVAMESDFFWYMFAGGVSYTLGVVVYSLKTLPFYHAVWHLFVLAGAASFVLGVFSFAP